MKKLSVKKNAAKRASTIRNPSSKEVIGILLAEPLVRKKHH